MSEIKVDQYTSLKLDHSDKYGYSIIEGWVTQDGE